MKVLILGGTGLIGSAVVKNAPDMTELYAIGRRLPDGIEKENFIQTDFQTGFDFPKNMDVLVIAFGTTIGKVKSKDKFHFVDVEIPKMVLKMAKETGVKKVLLVSSIGTSQKAKSFYLKCKWELEQFLVDLDFENFTIYRPSMLRGNRQEFRWKEELGLIIMRPLEKLMPKLMRSYASVSDEKLANRIWKDASQNVDFKGVLESNSI